MEHDGIALAADETDVHHHRTAGLASVHVRAVITWVAIFPMAALGMSVLAMVGPKWPPVLRALVLTVVVVPTAVYFAVPRLLLLHALLGRMVARTRGRCSSKRAARVR